MAAAPLSPRGAETVLIVEDEAAVRRMAARALAAQGYAILEAANGAEALEVLSRTAGPVDLRAHRRGDADSERAGARRAARRRAARSCGVLFMSGYTDSDIVRRGLLRPDSPFLQKPFMAEDLSRKVREVLDTP